MNSLRGETLELGRERRRRASSATPASASSSSRRSSVVIRSTRFPIAIRGCGSKVITVGSSPESIADRSTDAMTAVDAVERADRDRARPALELRRCVRDPHAPAHRREPGQRLLEGHHALLVGLVDRERPDLGASQADAVTAERVGDRADVGPRADEQVERARCRRRSETSSSSWTRIDARRHLDGDALAVQPVGALAVDLHGRRRRDRQLDRTAKAVERARRARRRSAARASRRTSPSGSPVVVRAVRSISVDVALVELHEPILEARRATGEKDEKPGRERVERARMAGLRAGAPRARARRSRTTTAPPACRRGSPPSARAPSGSGIYAGVSPLRARTRRTMRRVISSIARSVEKPGGALVATAAEVAGDRGDVDLVGMRPERALSRGAAPARKLADERHELGAVDRAQVVDDPLRVRLVRARPPRSPRAGAPRRRSGRRPAPSRARARARAASASGTASTRRPRRTPCVTSAPASTSSAASRSAFGVVFEYWNRPVSVTIAV